ncbi:hypothetical protein [Aquimarina longa]|uniref:hypothetical protein n=1 Tax=Aquimarina longa TaxID=1080221 RepID=UPI000786010F|nr:hypothetical protein [Aquimarina longa]
MIAGETEQFIEDHLGEEQYDDFFRSKAERIKRRALRKAKRQARKKERQQIRKERRLANIRRGGFFSRLGQAYRDLGGGQAIGGAVDTVLTKPIPVQSQELAKDYNIGLKNNAKDTTSKDDALNDDKKKPNYTPYIIGGVALLFVGIAGVILYNNNQKKYLHITKK